MGELKSRVIREYNMTDMDWLGYQTNQFDQHHIIKKENGGKMNRGNIALLGPVDHKYLHIVEYKDIEMYYYINAILKMVNEQGYMPTLAQLKAVDSVFNQFEREHCSDINARGEYLIREEYTKRLVKKL